MILPSVKDLKVVGKKVLLRTDFDVPFRSGEIADTTRIEKSLSTIRYLLGRKARVIIISHRGRPEGKPTPKLSLRPIREKLSTFLFREVGFLERVESTKQEIVLLENLRFWPAEEKNEPNFAKELAGLADFYVNEAFAVSHRRHSSVVGLPQFLSSAFGLSFLKEIKILTKIRENPERPLTLILGGVKKDKLAFLEDFVNWADWLLIGGKLAEKCLPSKNQKIIVARLNSERKDISQEAIEKFKEIIFRSKTVVWAGPMGLYEEKVFAKGTRKVAEAIAESGAISIVGGGDTEAVLSQFGLEKKISFISSGGGAMLEFLVKGTLPGIEAIKNG